MTVWHYCKIGIRFLLYYLGFLAIVILSVPLLAAEERNCYEILNDLRFQRLGGQNDRVNVFKNTQTPMVRAFEKEGLYYDDIAEWFDNADRKKSLEFFGARLKAEDDGVKPAKLTRWLRSFPEKYATTGIKLPHKPWSSLSPKDQMKFIFDRAHPFEVINPEGRTTLFLEGDASFNILRAAISTPKWVTVGHDSGSYEVRSTDGEIDRLLYQTQLKLVEAKLDGKVGHQHLIHEWPKDREVRKRMASYYVELLDASSWFLFWRQINRNPEDVASILKHRYLGIYNRASLERLEDAFIAGDYSKFKNKYRMVGARNVKGREGMQGQTPDQPLADFERRSGNKGNKREFIEDVIEARFMSGDYSGLRSLHEYQFDASAPIGELALRYLPTEKINLLEKFEATFKGMKYSSDSRAYNHSRNKIIAPLLPWGDRIPLGHKQEVLERAQRRFANGLAKIAAEYLNEKDRADSPQELGVLNSDTMNELEKLSFRFADRVRLHEDFEHYLTPRPNSVPGVLISSKGSIDVNKTNLGIEYSFRFPDRPRHRTTAKKEIEKSARALASALGATKVTDEAASGHGHNLSIKYILEDKEGRTWRVEWDGINRTYVNGQPINPRHGHIEIPSPKWAPQTADDIVTLYETMRELDRLPKRGAGGAHVNVDLAPLMNLPPKVGARKMANLINYFESNREMIQFLWQHPFRVRAADRVELHAGLVKKLNDFNGDWDDLGKLLYEQRYFNPFQTRKPAYTQLNASAVMGPMIPDAYNETIDIRNPESKWFPAFGGKGKDRIEFRLFDAPPDEYLAALQIKYVRALLNQALNSKAKLKYQPVHSPEDFEHWKQDPSAFVTAAEKHMTALGLDPKEFRPLIVDAPRIQVAEPSKKAKLVPFLKFLPAKGAIQGAP